MQMKSMCRWLSTLGFLSVSMAAISAEAVDHLKRIQETKLLVAAHRETSVPFSYIHNRQPIGFGVDITKQVLDALRKELNAPDVQIRWNPVTLSTRIPMVINGTVDIECGLTTNTRARQASVAFSTSYYISDEGIAVRRGVGIGSTADLKGKRVAVSRGTTNERRVRALDAEQKLGLQITTVRNNRLGIQLLASGQVDAFFGGETSIAGELIQLEDADAFEVISTGGYKEAYACMLPKNDPAFKEIVDRTIIAMIQNGEMGRLYAKWFEKPIKPTGRALGIHMNPETKALYAAPHDKPSE